MERDVYSIEAEIRTADHQLIKTQNNIAVTGIDLESVSLMRDNMERYLQIQHTKLQALMPTHRINLTASVHNSISGTFMVMFSYYGDEKRFVKH